MLADLAVFWLHVTVICSFLHYITLPLHCYLSHCTGSLPNTKLHGLTTRDTSVNDRPRVATKPGVESVTTRHYKYNCSLHTIVRPSVTPAENRKNIFHHVKGRGCNINSYYDYLWDSRWKKYFCCFICVSLLWPLHVVMNICIHYMWWQKKETSVSARHYVTSLDWQKISPDHYR